MKKMWIVALAMTVALAIAPFAKADTYSYDFTGSQGESGAFTVSATSVGGGVYDVTSGTLTVTGAPYSGAFTFYPNPVPGSESNSPSGLIIYDDLLYPNAGLDSKLDTSGLLFTQGSAEFNIFGYGGNIPYGILEAASGGYPLIDVSVSLAPIPELASLLLLGSGLLLLASGVRWKMLRARTVPSMSRAA